MRIAKPLLIAGIAIATLVLVAELIVRFAFPVSMEPSGSMSLSNEIPGLKQSVSFRYDGDQLRKLNWSKKRSSGNPRILCIGGNGTTAMLQNAGDTWWGQLAAKLSDELGKPVEVAALAHLPGGQILPALARSEKLLERYDVDLVVVALGFGDTMGFPGDYKYDPKKLDTLRAQEPKGFKYKLAKASHLLRIIRNSRRSKSLQQRQQEIAKPNFYRDYLAELNRFAGSRPVASKFERTGDDPLREYVDGVAGFIDLAKREGSGLLFVGEPTIYKSSIGQREASRITVWWNLTTPEADKNTAVRVAPLAVESELQRFATAAGEKCAAAGVPFVNLQGEIPRYVDNFVTETYLTDEGAMRMAEKLVGPVKAALGGG